MKPTASRLTTFYAPHGVKLVTSKDREADGASTCPCPTCSNVRSTGSTRAGAASVENREGREFHLERSRGRSDHAAAQRDGRAEQFAAALAKDEEQTIGVICMYKKQRELERRFAQQPFDPAFRRTVKIDTVDSYQGKENAIVILSLVRANGHFEAGHVRSPHRCNVAISRARERLFIIGNTMMWRDKRCRSPMRSVIDQIDRDRTGNAAVVRMDAIR
jgi:hypothetical protein